MSETDAMVFVVDDDAPMREITQEPHSVGWTVGRTLRLGSGTLAEQALGPAQPAWCLMC
jgi:alkyl hydroperoxide reductase subunit AhpC